MRCRIVVAGYLFERVAWVRPGSIREKAPLRSGPTFAFQSSMTPRRQCPICGTTGYVRIERVFKAGKAISEVVCGACQHAWQETDEAPKGEEARRDG